MEIILRKKFKIRLIKYTFLAAGILVVGVILYSKIDSSQMFKNYESERKSDIEHIKKSKDTHSLSINKSIFEGLTKDLSPYKIIARQVDKIDEDNFDLSYINGNYFIDGSKLKINALSGQFNSSTNDITLNENVNIIYKDISFSTMKIRIDVDNKEAFTDEPVVVRYKNSQIKSDSFETDDNSNIIKFEGDVESTFNLDDFK